MGVPQLFAPDAELAGTRALVVDDEPDVLGLMELLLATFGVEVEAAASGDDAFARFTRTRPDIVISDIQMPNGSGLDLIRRIRALPPERGGLVPAIAVSGGGNVGQTLDAGFHFHLTKPAAAQALLDAVRSFVREEQRGRDNWSLGVAEHTITLRLEGHFTGADMRAMTTAVVSVLHASRDSYAVVADLRKLTSFSPSVGAVAEVVVWEARDKIRDVVIIGGSTLARAISRSACLVLGIAVRFVDEPPPAG